MNYSVGKYRDYSTGRERYAVFEQNTKVWYFPKRYGKKEAERLRNVMEKSIKK